MTTISANELKTRGVSAIEAALSGESEAVISVRGRKRFVVMPIEQFQFLRECELEAALAETRADLEAGRFAKQSAEAHVNSLEVDDEG